MTEAAGSQFSSVQRVHGDTLKLLLQSFLTLHRTLLRCLDMDPKVLLFKLSLSGIPVWMDVHILLAHNLHVMNIQYIDLSKTVIHFLCNYPIHTVLYYNTLVCFKHVQLSA